MTEKDIDRIADRVAEKLKQMKKIDKYKETEAMLRAYLNYKRVISKNNERIDNILKNGLGEARKGKTGENVQGGLKKYEGVPEKEIEKVEHLRSENLKMEKRIIRVDNALMNIKNDKYYDVIVLRYFKEWTIDEIADEMDVDRKTVGRNRTRLVKELQFNLFPEILLD
ncbi:sigma factor-like helix-turn-helix DNA-binding protein [Leptotrichia trevisanii]|uniref:sigma factor-like helix-turn-helix DNA-binding protein n=1 Tax=Leptotrichia trevisanii TaxID=109328 RepID=UPI0026EE4EE4|nr:sigma factor-like helix-turn-helix DNA-binding protein [Leptotrichia trevisanii]